MNSDTPGYTSWKAMRARCSLPSGRYYHVYKGIKICPEWDNFNQFLKDMGKRPSLDHTLDRIDNDGDYEPSNCRWATHKEQQRNRRNNRFIEFEGQKMCVEDWADELGIASATIRVRLKRGWSIERALTQRVFA